MDIDGYRWILVDIDGYRWIEMDTDIYIIYTATFLHLPDWRTGKTCSPETKIDNSALRGKNLLFNEMHKEHIVNVVYVSYSNLTGRTNLTSHVFTMFRRGTGMFHDKDSQISPAVVHPPQNTSGCWMVDLVNPMWAMRKSQVTVVSNLPTWSPTATHLRHTE